MCHLNCAFGVLYEASGAPRINLFLVGKRNRRYFEFLNEITKSLATKSTLETRPKQVCHNPLWRMKIV